MQIFAKFTEKKSVMEKRSNSYKIKNPIGRIQTLWYRYVLARKIAPIVKSDIPKRSPKHLYSQICFFRYKTSMNIHDDQFLKEITRTEENQPTGCDAMRMRRLFSVTMLWPPMHSKREIRKTFKNPEMTEKTKERRHLENLLK